MALVTLESVRTAMAIPAGNTSKDALIVSLLPVANAVLKKYLKRNIEQATYTEYYSGTGRPELVLRNRPILVPSDIAGVWIDQTGNFGQSSGAFPASGLQTLGTDYMLRLEDNGIGESGILLRATVPFAVYGVRGTLWGGPARAQWPAGQGNIKVTYTAGYATVPDDIKHAGGMLVALMLRIGPTGVGSGALTSEGEGGYSYSLAYPSSDEPPEIGAIRQLLSVYREVSIGY